MPRSKHNITCLMCGSEAEVWPPAVTCRGCAQRYARLRKLKDKTCEQCGAEYVATQSWSKYCSRVCQEASRRVNVAFDCAECGEHVPVGLRRKYCSEMCAALGNLRRTNARVTDLYRLACQKGVGGARWRVRLVRLLVERDGDCCYLCGLTIDTTLKAGPRGDEEGPSIDHVVPRSRGGTDDLVNLRLTHWKCNRDKGTRSFAGASANPPPRGTFL